MNKFFIRLVVILSFNLSYAQTECVKLLTSITDKASLDLEFSNLVQEHPRLGLRLEKFKVWTERQSFREPISEISELPFQFSSAYRKIPKDEMIKRYSELDERIQKSIIKVYNLLSNKEVMISYSEDLFKEASVYMFKNPRRLDLRSYMSWGTLDNRAYANVLIQRMKSRGDTNFVKLHTSKIIGKVDKDFEVVTKNDQFRQAIASGPFFDMGFDYGFSGHGVFSHMIQRDIVRDSLIEIWGEDYLEFYQFLATKSGVNWWIDIFDAASAVKKSFVHPENLSSFSEILRTKYLEDY